MKAEKKDELYGWDDGKVFFWDQQQKKEWCVTDEVKLYKHLIKTCREYFVKKSKEEIK